MSPSLAAALTAREELPRLLAAARRPRGGPTVALGVPPGADDVVRLAARAGIGARPVTMRATGLRRALGRATPILLDFGRDGFLLLREVRGRRALAMTAAGSCVALPLAHLASRLLAMAGRGGRVGDGPEALASQAAAKPAGLPDAVVRLLDEEHARQTALRVGWLLEDGREEPSSPHGDVRPGAALLAPGPLAGAALVVLLHLAQFAFWILAWVLLARIVSTPSLAGALLPVWLLSLGAALLLNTATRWVSGSVVLALGTRIKQRILRALLRPAATRAEGAGLGRLIATAIDTNGLDLMAANGAVATTLALAELVLVVPLMMAAGAGPLAGLLFAVLAFVTVAALRYARQHRRWHAASLAVTAAHTEEMVGHRARKVLLGHQHWYEQEDALLSRYHAASRASDRRYLLLRLAPRLWLLTGTATTLLASQLLTPFSEVDLMAFIGLLLLTSAALMRLERGLRETIDAAITFQELQATFTAPSSGTPPHDGTLRAPNVPVTPTVAGAPAHGTPAPNVPAPGISAPDLTATRGEDVPASPARGGELPALVVRDLAFRYPRAAREVFAGVCLDLSPGERVTLEGPSGGGKSTLARVLAARLRHGEGAILLDGLDVHALGQDPWRQRVCYVPQSHDNHVLTETVLFNLLLGRGWPATPATMAAVEQVVAAVGLAPVIARMPAGLQQMVGEGGWRLSQGERARLYVARGLLQGARLLVLDEPLATLDPATASDLLDAVEASDAMVMMITHR